jgi:uracil-DNA glycosylase
MRWDNLEFWTKDWPRTAARFDYFDGLHKEYNPKRDLLFAAMDETPFDEVKVAWILQDPYPKAKDCTGVALAVPNHVNKIPRTLANVFSEYRTDLGLSMPAKTDLTQWTSEGVFLWNSIPSCFTGSSLSHDWPEWKNLTREIVSALSEKGDVVFVLSGRKARGFKDAVDLRNNSLIETAHPGPQSVRAWSGCRVFTTVNILLRETHKKDPVDWEI